MRLVADENFPYPIVDGVRRRDGTLDIVRVQEVGLRTARDEVILAWAAAHDRVLLTGDVSTVPALAMDRVAGGERMPGVIVLPRRMPIGAAIEAIIILARCTLEGECEDQVVHLRL